MDGTFSDVLLYFVLFNELKDNRIVFIHGSDLLNSPLYFHNYYGY